MHDSDIFSGCPRYLKVFNKISGKFVFIVVKDTPETFILMPLYCSYCQFSRSI